MSDPQRLFCSAEKKTSWTPSIHGYTSSCANDIPSLIWHDSHWSSTVRSQIYVVWLSSLIIIIFSLIIHHIFILSNQNNWLSSYFLVRTIYPNLVIPPETVRIDWQLRGAKGRRRDELQQHWHTWRLDLVVEPSENYESQLGSSSHIN